MLQQIVREYASEDIGVEARKALASARRTGAPATPSSRRAACPTAIAPGRCSTRLFRRPRAIRPAEPAAEPRAVGGDGNADCCRLPTSSSSARSRFARARLLDANVAHLRGAEAVYQLLERPAASTFQFASRADSELPAGAGTETLSLLFEGMRRYDELQRAAALVPDTAPLASTGMAPTSHPEEKRPVDRHRRVDAGARRHARHRLRARDPDRRLSHPTLAGLLGGAGQPQAPIARARVPGHRPAKRRWRSLSGRANRLGVRLASCRSLRAGAAAGRRLPGVPGRQHLEHAGRHAAARRQLVDAT